MTTDASAGAPKVTSRRGLFKGAAVVGGTAALGFPAVARAQTPVKWRIQTAWSAGTAGYKQFQKFCANVKELSEGKLQFQPFPEKGIVGTFEMFNAVKAGQLDAMHCFSNYWPGNMPVSAFLSYTEPTTCSSWAKRDPLAKEAFASQLAFMRTISVGYVPDAMLVDIDGKTKLTL